MKNLETLQKRVQKMVDGEKKRRQVALDWIDRVVEVLEKPCFNILGNMSKYVGEDEFSVPVWGEKDGKKIYRSVFFSYWDVHSPAGFYMSHESYPQVPVNNLNDMSGVDFWRAIKNIIDWLPLIEKDLERRSNERQALVEKLLVS